MNRRRAGGRARPWCGLLLASLCALAARAGTAPPPEAIHPAYPIDTTRSQAVFGVRVLWLHTISGRFAHIVGMVQPQPDHTAVVDASIGVESVEMASERTRRWMLSPDFFDAGRYPQIRFDSDPVPMAALSQGGQIDGRLTMRGQVQPVRFDLLPSHCALAQPDRCVIELRGSISRSQFGMSGYLGALSDRVDLTLEVALAPPRETDPSG